MRIPFFALDAVGRQVVVLAGGVGTDVPKQVVVAGDVVAEGLVIVKGIGVRAVGVGVPVGDHALADAHPAVAPRAPQTNQVRVGAVGTGAVGDGAALDPHRVREQAAARVVVVGHRTTEPFDQAVLDDNFAAQVGIRAIAADEHGRPVAAARGPRDALELVPVVFAPQPQVAEGHVGDVQIRIRIGRVPAEGPASPVHSVAGDFDLEVREDRPGGARVETVDESRIVGDPEDRRGGTGPDDGDPPVGQPGEIPIPLAAELPRTDQNGRRGLRRIASALEGGLGGGPGEPVVAVVAVHAHEVVGMRADHPHRSGDHLGASALRARDSDRVGAHRHRNAGYRPVRRDRNGAASSRQLVGPGQIAGDLPGGPPLHVDARIPHRYRFQVLGRVDEQHRRLRHQEGEHGLVLPVVGEGERNLVCRPAGRLVGQGDHGVRGRIVVPEDSSEVGRRVLVVQIDIGLEFEAVARLEAGEVNLQSVHAHSIIHRVACHQGGDQRVADVLQIGERGDGIEIPVRVADEHAHRGQFLAVGGQVFDSEYPYRRIGQLHLEQRRPPGRPSTEPHTCGGKYPTTPANACTHRLTLPSLPAISLADSVANLLPHARQTQG